VDHRRQQSFLEGVALGRPFRRLLLLAFQFAGGCEQGRLETELLWEGEAVRIFRERGSDVTTESWCPGTFTHVDSFIEETRVLLSIPDDGQTDYVLFPSSVGEHLQACAGATGCVAGKTVYTSHLPHHHEGVHTLLNCQHFFDEGAASYFGGLGIGPSFVGTQIKPLPDVTEVMEASYTRRLSLDEYESAAQFVAYLAHAYGVSTLANFLKRSKKGESHDDTLSLFREFFGQSLEDSIGRYYDGWPECSYEGARNSQFECAASSVSVCSADDQPLTRLDFDVSCESDTVVGPRAGWIWRDVVFEVATTGPHRLVAEVSTVEDGLATYVHIKQCSTECDIAEPREVPVQSGGNLKSPLDDIGMGRYVVRLFRDASQPGTVSLQWECGAT
jgi:hypothetical protein